MIYAAGAIDTTGSRYTCAIQITSVVFFCPKACVAVISERRTASSHFMFSASCVLKNFLPMRLPAQNCMRQHTRLTAAKHASRPLSMLLSIIVFLLLGVFGNALLNIIAVRFPIATYAVEIIIDIKNVFLLLFATVIFTLIYRFMPGNEIPLSQHLPGAVVSSLGWFLFSYAFSVYVDDFSGFSNMYGSLTALILLMLWLYFGMYITLIGAEFNQLLVKRREKP